MKRLPTLLLFTVIYYFSLSSAPFTVEDSWKKIETALENGYPKTALAELSTVREQALSIGDINQGIKAKMYELRIQAEEDPLRTDSLLKEAKQFADQLAASPGRMLMYLMLADAYSNYQMQNRYRIANRSAIPDPHSIDDWSELQFRQQIHQCIDKAFENPDLLQNYPVGRQDLFIVSDSLKFNSSTTLYDLMVHRVVEILSRNDENTDSWLKKHLGFRKSRTEIFPLIIAELRYAEHQFRNNTFSSAEKYTAVLDSLEKVYALHPEAVEILIEKAGYYLYESDKENKKRIAYNICENGIQKHPTYPRIFMLQNIKNNILQEQIEVNTARYAGSGKTIGLQLTTTNVTELTVEIYRLNSSAIQFEYFLRNEYRRDGNQYFSNGVLVYTKKITLPGNDNFTENKKEVKIPGFTFGIYEIRIIPAATPQASPMAVTHFTVTDLTAIKRPLKANTMQLFVLDRNNGAPQKKVTGTGYTRKWKEDKYDLNKLNQEISKADGSILITEKENNTSLIHLTRGADRYCLLEVQSGYTNFTDDRPGLIRPVVSLLTDRSIYRPGQTVYFKAIATISGPGFGRVLNDTLLEINLLDANNQHISSQKLRTNKFGSAAGSVILPENSLNGYYTLQTSSGSKQIRVEEYKRPTFKVEMKVTEEEKTFGKPVTFEGEATSFAGFALQQSSVNYRIYRRMMVVMRRFNWFNSERELVAEGRITTDASGKFTLHFTPEKTQPTGNYFQYEAEADIVSLNGESQRGTAHAFIGEKSLILIGEMPELAKKNKLVALSATAQTPDGKKVDRTIYYRIDYLPETETFREDEDFSISTENVNISYQTIKSGNFLSTDTLYLDLKKQQSGQYRIFLHTFDAANDTVKTEQRFILFSDNDKKPPVLTYLWQNTPSLSIKPGNTATILFGTSVRKAWILAEVMHGKSTLRQEWIRISDTLRKYPVKFDKMYQSGMEVRFTIMQNGKIYQKAVRITAPEDPLTLTPALTVFRDKLKPGSSEIWTVQIPEAVNLSKQAELLAAMYDASLDQLYRHFWLFSPAYQPGFPYTLNWNTPFNLQSRAFWTYSYPYLPGNSISESSLTFFGAPEALSTSVQPGVIKYGAVAMGALTKIPTAQLQAQRAGNVADDMNIAVESSTVTEEIITSSDTPQPVSVRTNFNETAFFYPQLYADTAGNYLLQFTLPDVLTTWNLKLLAHTADLYHGQAQYAIVSQKELMVQLNLPRFVRQSDEIEVQAEITNLTSRELPANVKFTVSNPVTGAEIPLPDSAIKSIVISGGGSNVVKWKLPSLSNLDLAVCRIEASSGEFSDGEQRYLPILSDKVLVTESIPFSIQQQQQQQELRFNTAVNPENIKQVSLEFTANPSWAAFQALPLLSAPENDNAIDLLGAWYSGYISRKIAEEIPELQAIINELRASGTTEKSLISELENNSDLQLIILKATPWLMEATKQTEQQQQLLRLFDIQQQRDLENRMLRKLSELQESNGSFSWIKGMPGNRFITQLVTEKLLRAFKSDTNVPELNQLIKKAIEFLDVQVAEEFVQLKKHNLNYDKQQTITSLQLHYMVIRSAYSNEKVPAFATEAFNYYDKQLKEYRTKFSIHDKALAVQYFYRTKQQALAAGLLRSLKEMAVSDKTKGMYWARIRTGWLWNERPLAIQTRIIQAFEETGEDKEAVGLMKLWLLNQKRTRNWDSPLTTLEAVEALLTSGDKLFNTNINYTFTTGSTIIEPGYLLPGSSYFRKNLQPEIQSVKIENNKSGETTTAWGALYRQSLQPIHLVKNSGSELKIERNYYLQKYNGSDKELIPVTDGTLLSPGDRIVSRLSINSENEYEFVVLRDNKAATLEAINPLSYHEYKEGILYYRSAGDLSTNYYIDYLPRGKFILEEEYYVTHRGDFSAGNAEIQCMYAPEYSGTSKGFRIKSYD